MTHEERMERGAEIAETWINGNKKDAVSLVLSAAWTTVDAVALALVVAMNLSDYDSGLRFAGREESATEVASWTGRLELEAQIRERN